MSKTDAYYEENAQVFFDGTIDVDMTELYSRFLPLVPDGGKILDAGCGSGRDALAFKNLGYDVVAFDASKALCKLSSERIGQTVECMRFQEITWQEEFDAVWSCASLLHVPKPELKGTFSTLLGSLKPGGVMYCSFKLGDSERVDGERHFTDMNRELFTSMLVNCDSGMETETWITDDQRPDRNERWFNAIVRI